MLPMSTRLSVDRAVSLKSFQVSGILLLERQLGHLTLLHVSGVLAEKDLE
jgi:hypothetical protein